MMLPRRASYSRRLICLIAFAATKAANPSRKRPQKTCAAFPAYARAAHDLRCGSGNDLPQSVYATSLYACMFLRTLTFQEISRGDSCYCYGHRFMIYHAVRPRIIGGFGVHNRGVEYDTTRINTESQKGRPGST